MKINKWSIVGGIIGIFTIIVSTIRWIFLYPDFSQFIIASSIGVILIGAAYTYDLLKKIIEDLKDTNNGIDALNIYYRDKIKKLREEIRK